MADNIKNGVHGCSAADDYIQPTDPLVVEKLESFRDRKIGLMIHWAPVTQLGITESWPQVDTEAEWSQKDIDWTNDMDSFRREYRDLHKTFNPIRFEPKKWASLAKECGFQYLLFTTKHHDGFCMWDTETTDYKITSKNCPFHKHSYKDIVKHLFNAFRDEGIPIHAYFSKPDWDSPYYWNKEIPWPDNKTDRNPNYKISEHPELWEQFVQFTHTQIRELLMGYGDIECLWLDGGWVNPSNLGQDIRIGEIVNEIRKVHQPGLICADRTVGGAYENFITPEQSRPEAPIFVPWESCITLGRSFTFRYDDTYKTPREVIHLLIDIVAKGGNLALNITPQPDGRLPHQGIQVLKELGKFLTTYGEGIYGTRVCEPYIINQYAFTKKENCYFVYYLYKEGERIKHSFTIPIQCDVTDIREMGTGESLGFSRSDAGLEIQLKERSDINTQYVEGFTLYLK
ncbi:alpha-L-fucosidase [Vallitalea okinawensis]|uniref:alpha-L-fucosidase n=1 Tax=Vallitalea okinawensis TaxID=2078660 RepID=UPI000CFA838F|nr:alpha-L-fucosidase [Vallitalea okinawensis]